CKCWVRQVSKREAEKLIAEGKVKTPAPDTPNKQWANKRTGDVEVLPEGIEPGWNYNPGKKREQALSDDLQAKETRL
ncbi:hypothetical protein JVW17_20790, partial [Vibrio cholerae O1]|nr:hypothetical protein [Vibrio cholerae O1]